MNLLYFLLPTLIYAFFNSPIHLYSKNIKGINNNKKYIEIKNYRHTDLLDEC